MELSCDTLTYDNRSIHWENLTFPSEVLAISFDPTNDSLTESEVNYDYD